MPGIPFTKGGPENGSNFEFHWTGPFLEAHFLSDVGKKRRRNEDSCLLCAPESEDLAQTRGTLFAVADGMGGASGGEFASRFALQRLSEKLFSGPLTTIPQKMKEAVEFANREVYEEAEGNPEYYGMGTTLSALLIIDNCAYVAHVGDSRVYLCRDNGDAFQVTRDHSVVAEQLRGGYITEEEARTHSMKNLITRAIGIREDVKVDIYAFYLMEGDMLLICSDGLCNMVGDKQISDTLQIDSVQGAARVLVGQALEGGGTDNISVSVVRVTSDPPKKKLASDVKEIVPPKRGLLGRLMKRLMA